MVVKRIWSCAAAIVAVLWLAGFPGARADSYWTIDSASVHAEHWKASPPGCGYSFAAGGSSTANSQAYFTIMNNP